MRMDNVSQSLLEFPHQAVTPTRNVPPMKLVSIEPVEILVIVDGMLNVSSQIIDPSAPALMDMLGIQTWLVIPSVVSLTRIAPGTKHVYRMSV